ncbi:hypothetical protein MACJ_004169 (apicoplast) [Theileria orientalis]|uniref:Uncharacterized protein n=1 Tax=Theileria orientalis TaxID=68886 RepID=A0A976XK54_THEOR|nr:hypothetical protein MACJ_004169 [Theileria orientalis]
MLGFYLLLRLLHGFFLKYVQVLKISLVITQRK